GDGEKVIATGWVAGDAGGTFLPFGTLTRTDNATRALGLNASGNGQMGGAPGAATLNLTFAGLVDSGGSGTARNPVPWAAALNGVASTFAARLVTYDANGFRPLDLTTEVAPGLT